MTAASASWRSVPLGELGTWYGGGTPSKARDDFWTAGTVPWLSPKDMGPEVVRATQDRITDSAVAGSAVRLVPAGSVAVVVRSGILERTVPIALVPMATTLNQDMKALVPAEGIDPRWVAWGLRSKERQLMDRCRKAGTTVASIDTKRLMAEELPVPPLDEQRRIVDLLEDHLSRVDVAVKTLEGAQVRLEGLGRLTRWRMFEQLTEGGLTPLLDACAIANGQTPKGVLDLVRAEREPGALPYFKVGDMNVGDGRYMDVARSYITPQDAESLGLSVRPAGAVLLP